MIDYDRIAPDYDRGRSYSQSKIDFWLARLREAYQPDSRSVVLDIGCGTGRYAVPIASTFSCRTVGLDISRKMLEIAREKDTEHLCQWFLGDAQELPFKESVFELCLISMVIHHILDFGAALTETLRVLAPGGKLVMRTCSHEQIKGLPDYHFFPRALAIDLARLPDVPVLESNLVEAGFENIEIREVISPSLESSEHYLSKLRTKHTSTLHLLSEAEYREGLSKAQRYFSRRSLPHRWRTEPITVIAASKSSA